MDVVIRMIKPIMYMLPGFKSVVVKNSWYHFVMGFAREKRNVLQSQAQGLKPPKPRIRHDCSTNGGHETV